MHEALVSQVMKYGHRHGTQIRDTKGYGNTANPKKIGYGDTMRKI